MNCAMVFMWFGSWLNSDFNQKVKKKKGQAVERGYVRVTGMIVLSFSYISNDDVN